MEEDLWEDRNWDGRASGGDFSILLNIRGWKRLPCNMVIWWRTTTESRARCGLSSNWRARREDGGGSDWSAYSPASFPPLQSETSFAYWMVILMEPRVKRQPHVPADWPPKSDSTLNFEQGVDGDDKIIPSGNRNMNVEQQWCCFQFLPLYVKIEKFMYESRRQTARNV